MTEPELSKNFIIGKNLLNDGKTEEAAKFFEKAYDEDKRHPMYMSYHGMCEALHAKKIGVGLELCTKAIKKEFHRAEYYVNLGRVYIAADNKKGAIAVAKKGIRVSPQSDALHELLIELGVRKRQIIPFLKRSNPLNKMLGIFFRRTLPDMFRKKGPNRK